VAAAVWLACGWSCAAGTKGTPAEGPAAFVAEPAPDLGPVVARVGGQPIFASELRAQSQRKGLPPRQALDELIRFQLLAERARERGIAEKITESQVPRSLLVQRLIEREFDPGADPEDVPEQELRRLYALNKMRYVHPRMVQVGVLSVYPPRGMPKPEAFAKARETALALHDLISKRPARTAEDFATLAKDPAWSSRKVSFSKIWQGPDEHSGPLRTEDGIAISRLRRPGDTTPLLDDNGAFHIARYIDEMAPKNIPFEKAREELQREYYPRWRQEHWKRFSARLVDQHRVEVFADKVAAPHTSNPGILRGPGK
jgi:peptidyl-prolyl cis-trans isomerase C